jgi:dCTP deaminase
MLGHDEIAEQMEQGRLSIDPFEPELLKRNSYVLRLGGSFRRISGDSEVDIADPECAALLAGEAFDSPSVVINSGSLVLAASLERISLPDDIVGVLSGISNVARLGVLVHATSAFINAGFGKAKPGTTIFEMATIGGRTVRLYRGLPICHIAFFRLDRPVAGFEPSRRTGQSAPGASELFSQFGHFIF